MLRAGRVTERGAELPTQRGTGIEAPQPTLPADEVEEKFSQRIEGQYCVGKSKAEWCPYVKRSQVTENYVFLVDGPTAAVVTKLADKKKDRRLAMALCDDLVKSESSDVIVVFGLTHFTVFGRHAIPLATCDIPR